MKPVYLIYKTDAHHTHDSRQLIGIATNTDIVIRLIKEKAKADGDIITPEQVQLLKTIKQTQSQGDEICGEFLYELQPVNELI